MIGYRKKTLLWDAPVAACFLGAGAYSTAVAQAGHHSRATPCEEGGNAANEYVSTSRHLQAACYDATGPD